MPMPEDLQPTWLPMKLPLTAGLTNPLQWVLHLTGEGTCGVTLDTSREARVLADWTSTFDVCLRCAVAHQQRLVAEIIRLQGELT